MTIRYGYCGPGMFSVDWKIEYGNGNVGVGTYGKLNTTLTRTRKWEYVNWYRDNLSNTEYIKQWVDLLSCPPGAITMAASMNISITDQYRWKPKESSVTMGDVINYNRPCLHGQKSRAGSRLYMIWTAQGKGELSDSVIDAAHIPVKQQLKSYLGSVSVFNVTSGGWVVSSGSLDRQINDWHSYSISSKFVTGAPRSLPEWTQINISVNNVNIPSMSILTVSDVVVFTDQSPYDTSLSSITTTLLNQASIN